LMYRVGAAKLARLGESRYADAKPSSSSSIRVPHVVRRLEHPPFRTELTSPIVITMA
jgi:hypothetical protein